jgi:hypothetical protein
MAHPAQPASPGRPGDEARVIPSKLSELPVSEDSSAVETRWDDFSHGLHWRGARTVYNVADALAPGLPTDLAPALARHLRHAGPAAARWLWLWLEVLDWEPLLTLRARHRFWRLPRTGRVAAVERWRHSRIGPRRRAFAGLARWLEAEGVAAQSADGA